MILPNQKPDAEPQAQLVQTGWANPWTQAVTLVAITLVVFWPVLGCDFLNYDDPEYFTSNPHVLGGISSENLIWAFSTSHTGNWHPLTWLSLMLDAQFFGRSPAGAHFTNLLLHALNTGLLFLLLRRMTCVTWPSLLVAVLFAVHPLHVESVAWVTERKDVLSMFFGLLALWAYANHVRSAKRIWASRDYWLAVLFFSLGLMSKPMLVTLPCVMLLLDWWPLRRFESPKFKAVFKTLLVEKLPFFGLVVASSVITFVVQKQGGNMSFIAPLTLSERVQNAFVAYARYLGKTFWPEPLAVFYPHPGQWPVALVALSVAAVMLITIAAIVFVRRYPFVFTGWFWFVGTLVPVIGIVQVGGQSMADRYTYLPLIGVFIIVAWGVREICSKQNVFRVAAGVAMAVVLLAAVVKTRSQLSLWQNSETLFRHALKVTKGNYVAANNLGTYLSAQGKSQDALEAFLLSCSFNPGNAEALYNLGNAFTRLGNADEAIKSYERVIALAPKHADAMNNLGFALATRQQYPEAVKWFNRSLQLKPDSADAHNNLASVLYRQNQFAEAVQHYAEAARLSPDNPQIYSNLGDALLKLGRLAEATRSFQEVLRLKPDDQRARARLNYISTLGTPP